MHAMGTGTFSYGKRKKKSDLHKGTHPMLEAITAIVSRKFNAKTFFTAASHGTITAREQVLMQRMHFWLSLPPALLPTVVLLEELAARGAKPNPRTRRAQLVKQLVSRRGAALSSLADAHDGRAPDELQKLMEAGDDDDGDGDGKGSLTLTHKVSSFTGIAPPARTMSSFLAKARPRRNSLLEEQKQSCHGLMGTSRNLNAVLESTNDELIKAAAARASEPFYQGHMCSIREDRAHKLCDEQLYELHGYNTRFFTRIFPKATRMDSSNFSPIELFGGGIQMVALNYQTHDLGMQLNNAIFRLNGNCGYVLKPQSMRAATHLPNEVSYRVSVGDAAAIREGADAEPVWRSLSSKGARRSKGFGLSGKVGEGENRSSTSTRQSTCSRASVFGGRSSAASVVPSEASVDGSIKDGERSGLSDVELPPAPPLRHPMPPGLHRYQITLVSGIMLIKPGEDRKHPEPWLQPEQPSRCPLNKRGPTYIPNGDDPIDPFVIVRVFGGRYAGIGADDDEVQHGAAWASRRIENNGLRPRWNETFIVYASQPDLAVIHFEIRTSSRTAVCYEAVPLRGMRTGHCVMALREPKTGARIQFSQLQIHIDECKIKTPERIAPMMALLDECSLNEYQTRFDELALDELDAFDNMSAAARRKLLTKPAEEGLWGGVGMTDKEAKRFTSALASKLILMQEDNESHTLIDMLSFDERRRSRRSSDAT